MGNLCCCGRKQRENEDRVVEEQPLDKNEKEEHRDVEEERSINEENEAWDRIIEEERPLAKKQVDEEIQALRNHFDIDKFNALFVKRGGASRLYIAPYDPDTTAMPYL